MPDVKTKYDHYLCVHGHFYQPPRENPWLDFIEQQKSAYPYHNWNERITRECYAPNARSRLLGRENRIREIVNNYEFISFNFGPTLLAWLENFDPWLYRHIISADHASRMRNAGHGNAIAQVYNHIIMPLANRRDKLTQIRWGIEDFRRRFGRFPEGMWLSETAADIETLELMAGEGIRFTILSPTQAKAVRLIASDQSSKEADPESGKTGNSSAWKDVAHGDIDTTRPYRVFLSKDNKRFIDIFFYDSSISRGIAYEKFLSSGADLLARIEHKCEGNNCLNGLINIATDGESYGHHFKFGEMALTWLIKNVEKSGRIKITNYGNYLEMFPPEMEVRIIENSSWSCAHGVERWRSDCGCNTGSNAVWNQKWRSALREALESLASDLALWFENSGSKIFNDPWAARDAYIRVILNPSKENSRNFIREHLIKTPEHEDETYALQLLESQRMSLYMFTSCGWFFDDISGLEATQVIMYACRAIDIAKNFIEKKIEACLIKALKKAKSNSQSYKNGARIYHSIMKNSRMASSRAAAHCAFGSLLKKSPEKPCPLNDITSPLTVRPFDVHGSQGLAGVVEVTEKRTWKRHVHSFAITVGKDCDHICLIGEDPAIDPDFLVKKINIITSAGKEKEPDKISLRRFKLFKGYSLSDLIPDCRNFLTRESASDLLKNIRETLLSSMDILQRMTCFIQHSDEPVPETVGYLLHFYKIESFERLMEAADRGDPIEFDELLNFTDIFSSPLLDTEGQGQRWAEIDLMKETDLKRNIHNFFRSQMKGIAEAPRLNFMENLIGFLTCIGKLGIRPDLWECQNMFYDLFIDPDFYAGLSAEKAFKFRELGFLLFFDMEEK